jgi:hypothetical protein
MVDKPVSYTIDSLNDRIFENAVCQVPLETTGSRMATQLDSA